MSTHATEETCGSMRFITGHVEYEGRTFSACGGVVDVERGYIFAYPVPTPNGGYGLTTWAGDIAATVRLVKKWRQRGFGGHSFSMYAWRATVAGKVFHGRNGGPHMALRLRAVAS